jgi:ribosomal protein S18 acetylase RimI-like enzyme
MLEAMDKLLIRPLQNMTEARTCADFMAASEPWLTLNFDAEQIFQRLTNPQRSVYVAEIKNQIIGALVLHLDGVLNGYIQLIAIHPDQRGSGLGTQLLAFAEEQIFLHSPNVFLCVSDFNLRAQKFYERHGYQRIGELPDFLVPGRAEILLRKTRGAWPTFQPKQKKI